MNKICILCGKEFIKPVWISLKNWNESRKYCSRKCLDNSKLGNTYRRGKPHNNIWNKGKKGLQVAWNKGKGDYAKKLGFGKWMVGKKASSETRKKMSETMKQRVTEGKHNWYIDGRTPVNQTIRRSVTYKLWREAVFKRDNWTCQWCKTRSGQGKKVILHADHIKPFAYFPQLRFEISNGRTLCRSCHAKTDTYKGRAINYYGTF